MANTSIKAAFERMWQHIIFALNKKSDITHNHDELYDAKGAASEVDAKLAQYAKTTDLTGLATEQYVDNAVENVSVEVDTTLAQSGKAADAKAVGDALSNYITSEDAAVQAAVILSEAQSYTDGVVSDKLTAFETEIKSYIDETFLGGEW